MTLTTSRKRQSPVRLLEATTTVDKHSAWPDPDVAFADGHCKRLLRDDLADAAAGLVELTNEQYDVLDAIGGNRQALILGGAGQERHFWLSKPPPADLGASVLLVCFNQLLGEQLAAEFRDNTLVTAGTFIK